MRKFTDTDRAELLRLYARLICRFGMGHVLRRMEQGALAKAAHARVIG